jgi:uncharacterized membrane protein
VARSTSLGLRPKNRSHSRIAAVAKLPDRRASFSTASDEWPRSYAILAGVFVAIGVVVRVRDYAYDRALWLDESLLSLNIIDRPFWKLFHELSFNQAAPPGFLLAERASIALFGRSEYALRVFPLVCGIASIFLFVKVARAFLAPAAALIAIGLFSVSDALVYYSSEVKQYSTDVAASLLIFAVALALRRSSPNLVRTISYVIAGVVALLLSYAAAFAVVAVILVMVVPDLVRRRGKSLCALDFAAFAWVAAILVGLVYSWSRVSHLLETNAPNFPTGLLFLRTAGGGLMSDLGIPDNGALHGTEYALGVVALVGLISLARHTKEVAALFAVQVGLLAVASYAHLYPVLARSILFLVPFLVFALAAGVVAISSASSRHRTLVAACLAGAVLAIPAVHAGKLVFVPHQREEIKPVLHHLWNNWQTGDTLFVFHWAQYPLRYYVECDCAGIPRRGVDIDWDTAATNHPGAGQYAPALVTRLPSLIVAKRGERLDDYRPEIAPLRKRARVWMLVTGAGPSERDLLRYLSCVGRRTDAFVRKSGEGSFSRAAVYRYDLTRFRSLQPRAHCQR